MPESKQSIRPGPAEIDFVCTDTEIKAALRLIVRTSKWREWLTLLCVILLLGIYCYGQSSGDRVVFPSVFGAVGVACLAWKLWSRRSRAQPENYTLTETGIRMATSTSSSEMPYSTFATCFESDGMFVLLDQ